MNNKIALITDLHWGVRNDLTVFHDNKKLFLDSIFFPACKKHNIDHVIVLGDIHDKRKQINLYTAFRMKNDFIYKCRQEEIVVDVVIGNHDTFHLTSNKVNVLDQITEQNDFFKWHTEPTEIFANGRLIAVIPWINEVTLS